MRHLRIPGVTTALAAGMALLLVMGGAQAQVSPESAAASMVVDPWPLTDELGRRAPLAGEVPGPRRDRFVAIFYFLWHDEAGGGAPDGRPYDISRIMRQDPDALSHPESPLWGPLHGRHYWSEPLFGYYLGNDEWVLRRHASLLMAAGVDTVIFDTTNAVTYPETYQALCRVWQSIRDAGGRTPQIAFMVNSNAGATARRIHEDLYLPGLYPDLWFRWEGKPLMVCDPAEADDELKAFFTLRRAHWPFEMVNTPHAWHWEATYPQPYGYTDDPLRPEQVNVSVAQNLRASDGRVTNMSSGEARGRGFHDGRNDSSPEALARGSNCEEQWRRARELDPPLVMVTGWNEWIAGRFERPGAPIVFVDQFDREYSRDIEPMRGGHGDNYYCQLVQEIRRYKGVAPLPTAQPAHSIAIDGPLAQWDAVEPLYRDDRNDTVPRDHAGAGGTHHVNRSGRNDLIAMKVAHDSQNVTFWARTASPLSASSDPGWMWLLIDADMNPSTGWQGYDFVVNRTIDGDGTSWLERQTNGWGWDRVCPVALRVEGDQVQLSVPRGALGGDAHAPLVLDFKWADHLQSPGDVADFYTSGDVAPEGRFRFRYQSQP